VIDWALSTSTENSGTKSAEGPPFLPGLMLKEAKGKDQDD
jgi:hypothetical protein